MKFKSRIGQRFGRLVVTEDAQRDSKSRQRVIVRCDCGNTKTVYTFSLTSGRTTSCGCFHRERVKAAGTKHGATTHLTKTREYSAWIAMKARCHNPKASGYPWYGARGIRVCVRWRRSFSNFLSDMGKCPEGLTIEREDNDSHYMPGNCRWATMKEQAQNRRAATT